MSFIKRLLWAGTALLILSGAALAQDTPEFPTPLPAGWENVGEMLHYSERSQHSAPHLALLPDGLPVVAWSELDHTFVARWNGETWEQVGGRITRPGEETALTLEGLAVDENGTIAVLWEDSIGLMMSVSDGGDWELLTSEPLRSFDLLRTEDRSGRSLQGSITDAELIVSPEGWVVAWREYDADNLPHYFAARWDGANWVRLGAQVDEVPLFAEPTERAADHFARYEADIFDSEWLALELAPNGQPVIAYTQILAQERLILIAEWDGEAWYTRTTPPMDGGYDLHDFALLPDGRALLARGDESAFQPVLYFEDSAWREIDYPMDESGDYHMMRFAPLPDGSVAALWMYDMQVGVWDGESWTMLTDAPLTTWVDSVIGGSDFDLIAAPDGTLYAAWIDSTMEGPFTRVAAYRP